MGTKYHALVAEGDLEVDIDHIETKIIKGDIIIIRKIDPNS
tara:strand:- start:505 stop:627 length:123 start_codon:yes stop_codon:yes gene_type:complete